MLPYRTGQLVWSKYLLSYLYTLVGGGVIVLGAFLRGVTTGAADWKETGEMCVMLWSGTGTMGIFGELPKLPKLSLPVMIAVVAALAAGATWLSFRMSVHFYKKRQNGAYA